MRASTLIAGVVGAVLVLTTLVRVHVWGDESRLWREATERSPAKSRGWINLGKQYALQGKPGQAEALYWEGLVRSQDPSRTPDERMFGGAIAEANLALLAWERGDHVQARDMLDTTMDRWSVLSVNRLRAWMGEGS